MIDGCLAQKSFFNYDSNKKTNKSNEYLEHLETAEEFIVRRFPKYVIEESFLMQFPILSHLYQLRKLQLISAICFLSAFCLLETLYIR